MRETKLARILSCVVLAGICASNSEAQQALPPYLTPQAPDPLLSPQLPKDSTPTSPHIHCTGGQLTIAAANSTLRSILLALQPCVLGKITLPDAAIDSRSWVNLGPGPVRQIVDQLLGSTQLNYVLEPSPSDPDKIQSILLIARSAPDDPADTLRGAAGWSRSSTPAREAWLASRITERPAPSPSDDQQSEPPETAPPTQSIAGDSTPGAVADATQANPPTPASSAAPSPDGAQGDKVLQNRITDMQQLFEQRKKLLGSSAASAVPPTNSN